MIPNLLQDVLTEGDYPTFREDLLRNVTTTARRKRLARITRHLALAACFALIAGVLLAPHKRVAQNISTASLATTAAPAVPVLENIRLRASQILETHSTANLVITTDHSHRLPSLTDEELLALFPHHSRGLASTWNGLKRFFFLDPKDAKSFTVSN